MTRHASSLPPLNGPAGAASRLLNRLRRYRWRLGGLAILWLGASLAWQVGSAPTGGLPLLS